MGETLTGVVIQASGHLCSDCGKELEYTEEVFLVQIIQPQRFDGKVFYHNVIDESDPQGDFMFDPWYFCFSCGENLLEGLKEDATDEPPVEDDASSHDCVCCGSGIRDWELAGTITVGELHISSRAPNGIRGPHFHSNGKPDLYCLYCMVIINTFHIELWSELSESGECADCIQVRCWRYDECECACHQGFVEPDDDDDDEGET